MRINIDFDSNDPVDTPQTKRFYRALASSLLHIIGDLDEEAETVPTGTTHSFRFAVASAPPPLPKSRPQSVSAPPLHSSGLPRRVPPIRHPRRRIIQ